MRKAIVKEILVWGFVSVLMPLVLPLLFVLCWRVFYAIDISSFINLLLYNGVYTFLVLTVLISLFQDYKTVKAPDAPLWVSIIICSFFTFIIFGSSIGFFPEPDIEFPPVVVTTPLLSLSLYFKFKITKTKHIMNNK